MFVYVIYIFTNLECIDCVREDKNDAYIYKSHPEVASEKPPCDKSKQHYDPCKDKVFDDIAYDDREIQELIKKIVNNSYYQRQPEQQ